MKVYDGAMLHGVNRQNVAPGELGEAVSLDLGMAPEHVVNEKIVPLIAQLEEVLKEYKVYFWVTAGYHEENTDNEV